MTRFGVRPVAGVALVASLMSGVALAQTPPPNGAGRGQKAGPLRGGRAALPAVTANMNQQQLQSMMDTYAVVQATKVLLLTDDQYPNFVARLTRLQQIRHRAMVEQRRLKGEIRTILPGNTPERDPALLERLKGLDDSADRTAVELRKAYLDLDAVLTPWQRGRFRLFEDEVEQLKISLLAKIGAGAGAGPAPNGRRF